jgi:hypothetical protein
LKEGLIHRIASTSQQLGGLLVQVMGWSVNWGRRMGLLDDDDAFPQIAAYVARLHARCGTRRPCRLSVYAVFLMEHDDHHLPRQARDIR